MNSIIPYLDNLVKRQKSNTTVDELTLTIVIIQGNSSWPTAARTNKSNPQCQRLFTLSSIDGIILMQQNLITIQQLLLEACECQPPSNQQTPGRNQTDTHTESKHINNLNTVYITHYVTTYIHVKPTCHLHLTLKLLVHLSEHCCDRQKLIVTNVIQYDRNAISHLLVMHKSLKLKFTRPWYQHAYY